MAEYLSRALSPDATAKLIDFIEAYVLSLRSTTVDAQAETAKQLAKAVLETDIDILVFTVAIRTIYASVESLTAAVNGLFNPREFAVTISDIVEAARSLDKQQRMS